MASNNNFYKKRRVKTKKVKEQIAQRNAPVNRYEDGNHKRKTIISIIAIGMVVLMLATMIIPYIGRVSNPNFRLSESALVAGTQATEQTFAPQMIMAGQIFNRPDNAYYVLIGTTNNTANYSAQLDLPVYIVDTSLYDNRNIEAGDTSALPKSISDIRFNEVALIKIENGQATSFENGSENVQKYIEGIE
jgi:hypothetical protein